MNKILKRDLFLLFFLVIYITASMSFGIYCPVRTLTGVPCPACGSSRALLSLAHFDIASYIYYNAMALPLGIAMLLGLHSDVLPGAKKNVNLIIIGIAVISFIYYIYRLAFSLIP